MSATPTIGGLLRRGHARYADLVALRGAGRAVTYGELGSLVRRAVAGLTELGLHPGDRVVTIAANSMEYAILDQACFLGGFVRVGLNRRLNPRELPAILATARPRLLCVDAEWAGRLRAEPAVRGGLPVLELDGDGPPGFAALTDRPEPGPAPAPPAEAPAALLFTSGTSGEPKAVVATQRSMAAMVRNVLISVPVRPGDRALHAIPLSHAAGHLLPAFACQGADQEVTPSFVVEEVLHRMVRDRVTLLSAVPTVIGPLARAALAAGHDVPSPSAIVYGGSPIGRADLATAVRAFPGALYQVYAQSESLLPITVLTPADHRAAAGVRPELGDAAGRPVPFIDLRVVDAEGERCAAGECGEVQVRGDTVMTSYYGDPEATAKALDADGWLRTGDVGYLDRSGYLHLVDRISDVIITGGFNVMPSEVERVLAELPAVREAAVFGVPDPRWGETICAAVVPVAPHDAPALESVQEFCRRRLAGFKVPRRLVVLDDLPYNATGKLDRRALRARYRQEERA
ncbi:acyl-CoA synthetase (AMP-forming)/AMP-acid ligase II [Thermocatellispora tengchongensis]|uniref:Acyl-CoA synthetase (AMP-forming)/AMP-acid ligase II n=1 Tax=Thermocatellispora tengchongensis TaxID=1073253 RepID=A0A840PJ29_9ACTN|nr:AMP-binding protein [Thermocatellispora tengchongensis]MBB5137821.1 acyl-CoA synthetase (AMP-forming)/AMP-acid ligase II [Thermocatellispora tengchongensis]